MGQDVVGRTEELDVLREFLDTSAADPRALVLEGHAGIGKSTLWLGAVDAARQRGRRVLITRPTEAEQGLAFAGLGDILESVADEVLASLLPPRRAALEAALLLGEARTDVHPRAVGVAVRDALALVAADHSLVVAIDDVQWLDESSSSALTFALRRLGGSAQFLLARRIEEGVDDSELEHAFAPDRIERVRLGPLSLGATQVLLDARLDRVFTRPVLQRIHTIAGGNPLYAIEVARIIGSGIDPTRPLPVPDSLDGLMAARLAGLPEESRSGLDLIAAAGDISWNRLRVAAVDPNGLQPALDAQVLESQGMTVRFAHPLLAAAYYQRLSPTRRQDAHRVVSNLVDDPVDRARHLALATDQPDADLAAALDDGVQAATARGAIASAVELGEHALRLTPPGDAGQTGRRTTTLARAHLAHATVDRAEELLRALIDHEGPGTPRAEALLALRDVGSDRDDPIALLREALEEADGDRTLQARIHTRLGWDLRFIGERVAAESHAAAALALAEQLDDAGLLAAALATFAGARHHNGEPDAFELADRACSMIADLTDTAVRIDVAGLLVTTFVWTGHHDRLRALFEPLCPELAAHDESRLGSALWSLALVELAAGRFTLAGDLAKRSSEIFQLYGSDEDVPASIWALAATSAYRGDLTTANRLAAEGLRMAERSVPIFVVHFQGLIGQVAQWSGDSSTACTHFAAAERANELGGSRDPSMAGWRADFCEALLACGRADEAITMLDAWERDAMRLGRSPVLARAHRCRGLLATAAGDVGLAVALLDQAAREHAEIGDPFGRGRALLILGGVHRRAGRKRTARAALEESLALFETCGADGWAEQTRVELGSVGGRTRQAGLTAAERRVADLVAEGRTNREVAAALFIGERTVETHLSHIYAKLGVRSRTELARSLPARI